jgi:hypothetical protein
MRNRYENALLIQKGGACNVSGIARTLVQAADDAMEAGFPSESDAAVRLIVHQLAHLCRMHEIDHGDPNVYTGLLAECETHPH